MIRIANTAAVFEAIRRDAPRFGGLRAVTSASVRQIAAHGTDARMATLGNCEKARSLGVTTAAKRSSRALASGLEAKGEL